MSQPHLTPYWMTVATNLTDLHKEASFVSELMTQVVNGQELEVLQESGRWCFVRQPDGYQGWAYKPYLADRVDFTPTHWVAGLSAELLASPEDGGPPVAVLLCGTAVTVDDARGHWVHVQPAGGVLKSGWIRGADVRAMRTLAAADARAQIVADARRFTGIYYLWGGTSSFGLDCSALAQITHRLAGYMLPRDAYMQCAAGKKAEPPYQPGDLLFFHGDVNKDRITHVGISLGGWEIIHSSRARNGVYIDDVQATDHLRTTFVEARMFVDR